MPEPLREPAKISGLIAVVAAVPLELKELRKLRFPGIVCLTTGVGFRNVEKNLSPFLSRHPVQLVLHAGFSGGLTRELESGDLVVADRILGARAFEPDVGLVNRIYQHSTSSFRVFRGTIVSLDEVIVKASDKAALLARYGIDGAACVDMESAAVAQICRQKEIPLLSVRCISDTVREDLPINFNLCRDSEGGISLLRVLLHSLRVSGGLNGLRVLHKTSCFCALRLAKFLSGCLRGSLLDGTIAST